MRTQITRILIAALVLGPALNGHAGNGVLEINQACALNGGCFSGDSAGFPVEIDQSGSYRLTSNLNLTGVFATSAIEVDASIVHIDLNGFSIIGPSNCTGIGAGLSCTRDDGGHGVHFSSFSDGSSVANGTVRGMAGNGILAGTEGIRMYNIIAFRNSANGIDVGPDASVKDCTANYNGENGMNVGTVSLVSGVVASGNHGHGIALNGSGSLVHSSNSTFNGGAGFNLLVGSKFGSNNSSIFNQMADDCGGGICTDRRRYYLTDSIHNGADADGGTACGFGFHFASIGELRNYSNYVYDTALGFNHADSGSGPPLTAPGWIRSGYVSAINALARANCELWSSSDGGHEGTAAAIWTDAAGAPEFPWLMDNKNCQTSQRVWCIED